MQAADLERKWQKRRRRRKKHFFRAVITDKGGSNLQQGGGGGGRGKHKKTLVRGVEWREGERERKTPASIISLKAGAVLTGTAVAPTHEEEREVVVQEGGKEKKDSGDKSAAAPFSFVGGGDEGGGGRNRWMDWWGRGNPVKAPLESRTLNIDLKKRTISYCSLHNS